MLFYNFVSHFTFYIPMYYSNQFDMQIRSRILKTLKIVYYGLFKVNPEEGFMKSRNMLLL